ncbi:MAG TPA: 50S ribosomal protein L11 methyltransferase [Pararhizobium sp.]|nr:50S ribosomal protein L11 methyltransferase [Pararhizobium sp.]
MKDTKADLAQPDTARFIRENLRLEPVPSLPDIRLYCAHPGSGLWRLLESDETDVSPPYWAYRWAGGMALAHHFAAHPEIVSGRRVLDLGAGSGLVGIAAARVGASHVIAAEIDHHGQVALELNAAANAVRLQVARGDLLAGPPPAVDLVAVGDLYYAPELAAKVTAFLDRCLLAGITVLIGDPGRVYLPRTRLRLVAEYPVPDMGDAANDKSKSSAVFTLLYLIEDSGRVAPPHASSV